MGTNEIILIFVALLFRHICDIILIDLINQVINVNVEEEYR